MKVNAIGRFSTESAHQSRTATCWWAFWVGELRHIMSTIVDTGSALSAFNCRALMWERKVLKWSQSSPEGPLVNLYVQMQMIFNEQIPANVQTHTQETHTHAHTHITPSKQFYRFCQTKALRVQEFCRSARGTCISTSKRVLRRCERVFAAVLMDPVYTNGCASIPQPLRRPHPSGEAPPPPPPVWARFNPVQRKLLLPTVKIRIIL